MQVIKFLIQYARPYWVYILGILISTLMIVAFHTINPYLVKKLIDIVGNNKQQSLWMICSLYGILQLIHVSAWILNDYCLAKYTSQFRSDELIGLVNNLKSYRYTYFQDQMSGVLTSHLNDIFQATPHMIWLIIHQFLYFIITVIITLIMVIQVHMLFGIIMLIWALLFIIVAHYGLKRIAFQNKEYSAKKADIMGQCADYISNILSIKTFANHTYEVARFNKYRRSFIKAAQKMGFFGLKFYSIQGVLTAIYSTSFIIGLIYCHQMGAISPGDFALIIMLNFNVISALFETSGQARVFSENWGSVSKALSVLLNQEDMSDSQDAQSLKITEGKITFDKVQFSYKNSTNIFNQKSVTIQGGQRVGLVGYSGGGKSTFVNLILRMYDVTSGTILIDGQDVRDITQDSLHQNIGMIPQEPLLFHRSLMENIRYGNIDATDEQVIAAARLAHADEFILKLPQGYKSLVGERGIKLSGGQRQRIAIARVILKNPPILILDEATSQLDSISERYIQDSLWQLMKGKTAIVIAHRLSTLLNMDRILVFEDGEIIEDGAHDELLSLNGMYKKLWDAQVNGFIVDEDL